MIASVQSPPSKRTLKVSSFLHQIDEVREIYPKGIIAALKELSSFKPFRKTSRVEWFADHWSNNDEYGKSPSKKKIGILREFFPAYSSEPKLLQLASNSASVIEIHSNNARDFLEPLRGNGKVNDKLILKGAEERDKRVPESSVSSYHSERTSELYVTSHWLDLTGLCSGDSNCL
jgi:hypothetical protein